MGRRIYDDSGNFVWKYTFGRQASEMMAYARTFNIGKYVDDETDNSDDGFKEGDDEYCSWEEHLWIIEPKKDLPKLEKLYKRLLNGKTEKELAKIGMDAVWKFVDKQSKAWKKNFAEDLKDIAGAKSCDDFKFGGSSSNGMSFEVYDIYARGVEKHLKTSLDFLLMTRAFIRHIKKYKAKVFIDEY